MILTKQRFSLYGELSVLVIKLLLTFFLPTGALPNSGPKHTH